MDAKILEISSWTADSDDEDETDGRTLKVRFLIDGTEATVPRMERKRYKERSVFAGRKWWDSWWDFRGFSWDFNWILGDFMGF